MKRKIINDDGCQISLENAAGLRPRHEHQNFPGSLISSEMKLNLACLRAGPISLDFFGCAEPPKNTKHAGCWISLEHAARPRAGCFQTKACSVRVCWPHRLSLDQMWSSATASLSSRGKEVKHFRRLVHKIGFFVSESFVHTATLVKVKPSLALEPTRLAYQSHWGKAWLADSMHQK